MIGSVAMMLEMSFDMAAEAKNVWAAMQGVFGDGYSTADLSKPGSGTLVTCVNAWTTDSSAPRCWVAHAREGGPLGEDKNTSQYWVLRSDPDIRGANWDIADDDLSAGGNVAQVDGSVEWKPLSDMDIHPSYSAGWLPTNGLSMW